MELLVRDAAGRVFTLNTVGEGTKENPLSLVVTTGDVASEIRNPLYQYLDTVGDGSGTTAQNVDGSVAPVSFKVQPPVGVTYGIAKFIFSLRDAGIDSGGWGGQNTPLINGILVVWHRGGQDIELSEIPIDSHYMLAGLSYDLSHNSWGQGQEYLVSRFRFNEAGQYILLNGDDGDYIEVIIQDDLTYLTDQRVSAQGYQELNT